MASWISILEAELQMATFAKDVGIPSLRAGSER